MTVPGGDAADRALDDALALANERRAHGARSGDGGGEGCSGPATPYGPNDPLAVALGLGDDDLASGLPGSPGARGVAGPGVGRAGGPGPESVPAPPRQGGSPGRAAGGRGPGAGRGSGGLDRYDPVSAGRRGAASSGTPGQGTGGVDRSRRRDGDRGQGQGQERGRHENRGGHRRDGHAATPWAEARRVARRAVRRLDAQVLPLDEAVLGMSLARDLSALSDLPSFDASAMDGWAVSGPGPWRLKGQVLAGRRPTAGSLTGGALLDGHAVRIATGAVLPPGTTAVLRSEHGRTDRRTDGEWLYPLPSRPALAPGQDVRRRGQECREGDELLPAGTLVTPVVLGLAAAAGYDSLTVTTRPRVEVLVLGDELLDQGLPRDGRVRDALGPMLPAWLRALGAEVAGVRRLVDEEEALRAAIAGSDADVLVTTGGTAGGPVDHVHPVLAALGAELLVDGVAVRPGHPMLLAALPGKPGGRDGRDRSGARGGQGGPGGAGGSGGRRHLIGLPGNPLAAVSGVLTLVAPVLRGLAGLAEPAPYSAPLTGDVAAHPADTRLVPVVFDDESAARPLRFAGPAMLRGLAAADGLAVVPPGGGHAGKEVAVLDTGMLGPVRGSGA